MSALSLSNCRLDQLRGGIFAAPVADGARAGLDAIQGTNLYLYLLQKKVELLWRFVFISNKIIDHYFSTG